MTVEELRSLKEKKGYSFVQVADCCGISIGTVVAVLSGKSKNPRQATLDALEKMLTDPKYEYLGRTYTYEEKARAGHYTNVYGEPILLEPSAEYRAKRAGKTIEDYYALPDGVRKELIDGKFYDMASPTILHQELIAAVLGTIGEYIRKKKGKCEVFFGPVDVQLDEDDDTMLVPDLLIVCDPDKIRKKVIFGAPDFVLEVLSPSTRSKDLFIKAGKYDEAGVREYWMIDPVKKVLISYNFAQGEYFSQVEALKGKKGLAIYGGDCKIDLSELAELIEASEAKE